MAEATQAIIGKGTTIAYGADPDASDSFTTIFLEVKKAGMPKTTVGSAKATNYTSPEGYHEYVHGWADGGNFTFEANYVKSDRVILYGLLQQYHYFQVTYPDGSTDTFAGFINDLGGEIPLEEVITAQVSIKVTGPIVFVEGE